VERTREVLKSRPEKIDLPGFELALPPSKIPGDLAANIALALAKEVKGSPRDLAQKIAGGISDNPITEKIDVVGPGFLNFWIKDSALREELSVILGGDKPKPSAKGAGEKILMEFVSANPTGPLHIGHGRGAALGDSLSRVFKWLGQSVATEFYINDAGGQIRNLGLSMEARIKELKGEKLEFPEGGYQGSYVVDLAKEALASGKKFKPIEPAQMLFTEGDLAGFAAVRILKMIQKDMDDFAVHFDNWTRESDLHKKHLVEDLFQKLKKKNHVYEEGGAFWFRATEFGDEKDRVLKKASEAPTYFASDIAYHNDKFARGFQKLINIWGADHHGYAQRLKGALKAIDHDPDDLVIILNQLVSIKGGRLSKRAGDMITLREVMDEVGKDATRFFFALRSPGAHFEFDLDLAKKQANDNPVFYVQYVHARCCSIFAEAAKRGLSIEPLAWQKLSAGLPALHESEKAVILHLMLFRETVELCARDYSNHHLTVYLLELAGKFHSFYEQCRVLEDDPQLRTFRLDLVRAIRDRVKEGLALLGVSAPDKL